MKSLMRSICLSLSCCLFVLTVSSGCKPTPTSQFPGSQDGMPIVEEKITLTWWIPFLSEGVTSWNNSPVFQEMERLSNIKIDFKTPSDPGQAGTQYQSMLASGMLPDILMHNWFGYPGGPDQAIEDKVYISLNELIEEDMPNYKKYISEPEVRRELLTLGGNFAWISAITQKGVEISPPYCGPIIRKDWLDKLNLDEPETIDDWYNMLKAFKLQLNIKNPLVLPSNGIYWEFPIMNAYGVVPDQYVVDGEVVYGGIQDGMLKYVTEMNKWFREGLLSLQDVNEAAFYNDTTGAWFHGFYLFEVWKSQAKDPNYRAIGVNYPVLNKGDILHLTSQLSTARSTLFAQGIFITTANKYPHETAKYFDYFYSDEGTNLQLYGVEGKNWTYVEGKPEFTDYMLNNPNNSFIYMLKKETFPYFVSNWQTTLPGSSPDEVDAFTNKWAQVKADQVYPSAVEYTPDEQQVLNVIYKSQIQPYTYSMIPQFIKGDRPLSDWQSFVDQINKMGLDQVLAIWQEAYDRYMEK